MRHVETLAQGFKVDGRKLRHAPHLARLISDGSHVGYNAYPMAKGLPNRFREVPRMPRIREIRYPVLSAVPAGLSVGSTLVALLMVVFVIIDRRQYKDFPPVAVVIWLAISSFFWFLTLLQMRVYRHSPTGRGARLNRLLATAAGRRRFPHRLLERCHRGLFRMTTHGGLRRAMGTAGNLVILANRRSLTTSLPRGAGDGFEPIPLYDDNARLADLASLECRPTSSKPPGSGRSTNVTTGEASSTFPPLQGLGRMITTPFRSLKYLVLLAIVLLFVVPMMRIDPVYAVVFLTCVVAACFVLYRTEGREYDWWLIPGGLVYRRTGLLPGSARVQRIPAAESTLFFDYGSKLHYAYVCHRHRLYRIACDKNLFPYLLAAWQNRARTPTEDELRDLFTGGDG